MAEAALEAVSFLVVDSMADHGLLHAISVEDQTITPEIVKRRP